MRDAARQTKRMVQMGTHWRSGPHYAEAVEMVRAERSAKCGRCAAGRTWTG